MAVGTRHRIAPPHSLLTAAERERRETERQLRLASRASREPAGLRDAAPAAPARTVWRRGDLPGRVLDHVGLAPGEVVTALTAGTLLYLPVALATSWSPWNLAVGAVLLTLSAAALLGRRVLVGHGFVAVRKTGPYRVVTPESLRCTQLADSAFGGVLRLRTGDGRTVRLRRPEFTDPDVARVLHDVVLDSGHPYDGRVRAQLGLPHRPDFGHR